MKKRILSPVFCILGLAVLGLADGGSAVHTAALGCFLTISNGEDNAGGI